MFGEEGIKLTKKKRSLTLGLKILMITVVALASATLTFYGSRMLVSNPIFEYIKSQERVQSAIERDEQRLQDFITDNDITLSNIDLLDNWLESSRYMIIYIIDQDDADIIYTNDYLLSRREVEIINHETIESSMVTIDGKEYAIEFIYPIRAESDVYANYLSFALGAFIFLLLFYLGIRKITRRITTMTTEIEVIGAGMPGVLLSDDGDDELGRLASEINALITELSNKNEELMMSEEALKDLVTSLAHDLRTPLTSLIGYITLLKYEKDPQELRDLLNRSEQKALQMKSISDELFALFSTLSLNDESDVPMEVVYAADFLEGSLENLKQDLAMKDFKVNMHVPKESKEAYLQVNFYYMERLFENILSNIRKYADLEHPVEIDLVFGDKWCKIEIKNTLRKESRTKQATGFGLMSCRKILGIHQGHFEAFQDEISFTNVLVLPLQI